MDVEALRKMGYSVVGPDEDGEITIYESDKNDRLLGYLDRFGVFITMFFYSTPEQEPTREDEIIKDAIESLVKKHGLGVKYIFQHGETPALAIKAKGEIEDIKKAIVVYKRLSSIDFEELMAKRVYKILKNAETEAHVKLLDLLGNLILSK